MAVFNSLHIKGKKTATMVMSVAKLRTATTTAGSASAKEAYQFESIEVYRQVYIGLKENQFYFDNTRKNIPTNQFWTERWEKQTASRKLLSQVINLWPAFR